MLSNFTIKLLKSIFVSRLIEELFVYLFKSVILSILKCYLNYYRVCKHSFKICRLFCFFVIFLGLSMNFCINLYFFVLIFEYFHLRLRKFDRCTCRAFLTRTSAGMTPIKRAISAVE